MFKTLVRRLICWAFEVNPAQWKENRVEMEVETTEAPKVYCVARPGLPGGIISHEHRYPYTEADHNRALEFGWQVNHTECLLPNDKDVKYVSMEVS